MATKKKKRVVTSSRSSRKSSSERAMEKNFPTESSSSYVNLLYGILSVFILFILVFTGIKFFLPRPEQHGEITKEAASTTKTQEEKKQLEVQNGVYVVESGDSLWSISEKVYKSGYSWVALAEKNNISDPGMIYKGMKLVVPSVTPIMVKTESPQTPTEMKDPEAKIPMTGKIEGDSYIIQKGDDLWDIAVRAYNDGYKWTEIAKANGLSDPNLIHSGNSIKIPR